MLQSMVAMLRGVNVGGKNKVKMAALCEALEASGLNNIRTYIQSGNLVFEPNGRSSLELVTEIQATLQSRFGLEVPVIVRSSKQFIQMIENNPWRHDSVIDPKQLHVTFLERKPASALISKLEHLTGSDDQFRLVKSSLYLHLPNGYSRTKLNNGFFESKLGMSCTTRNWKTCLALQQMLISPS